MWRGFRMKRLVWIRLMSFKRSVFNKTISFTRSYAAANQNAVMG
jgi:hypothetical protein